jgi:hypothetical protein
VLAAFALLMLIGTFATVSQVVAITPVYNYLLKIEYRGGLCHYGECYAYIAIYKDGTVIHADQPNVETKSQLDSALIADLTTLIENANYAALRAVEFTGLCPTAVDGTEIIYTFYPHGKLEAISTCQFEIDFKQPLFSKLNELLPRISTVVPPRVTTPTAQPTATVPPLLEALVQKLSETWNDCPLTIRQHQAVYRFGCSPTSPTWVTVSIRQFPSEAAAQRAFPLNLNAEYITFHGFRALTGVSKKDETVTEEFMIIQARTLIISISSSYEFYFTWHATDAAEDVYKAMLELGMVDLHTTATPTP